MLMFINPHGTQPNSSIAPFYSPAHETLDGPPMHRWVQLPLSDIVKFPAKKPQLERAKGGSRQNTVGD